MTLTLPNNTVSGANTVCVEFLEFTFAAAVRALHQELAIQPVVLYKVVRESDTVRTHWVASAVVYVADFLVIIICHCLIFDLHGCHLQR